MIACGKNGTSIKPLLTIQQFIILDFAMKARRHLPDVYLVIFLSFVEGRELRPVQLHRRLSQQYSFGQAHIVESVKKLVSWLQNLELKILEAGYGVFMEHQLLLLLGPPTPSLSPSLLHFGAQQTRHYLLLLFQDDIRFAVLGIPCLWHFSFLLFSSGVREWLFEVVSGEESALW